MKREQFKITSSAGHSVVKFAWNAANREVERLIRETARAESAEYHLTRSTSVKSDRNHVSGVREWTRLDGHIVTFSIENRP